MASQINPFTKKKRKSKIAAFQPTSFIRPFQPSSFKILWYFLSKMKRVI